MSDLNQDKYFVSFRTIRRKTFRGLDGGEHRSKSFENADEAIAYIEKLKQEHEGE